jgi:hypothetical protein
MNKEDVEDAIKSLQVDPDIPAGEVTERINRLQALLKAASHDPETLRQSATLHVGEVLPPLDSPTPAEEQVLPPSGSAPSAQERVPARAASPPPAHEPVLTPPASALPPQARAGIGPAWLPEMFALAAQFNDPWLPSHSEGLYGWNLTGTWASAYPGYEVNLLQYGTYVVWMGYEGGRPAAYGRGILDPSRWLLHVVGSDLSGWTFHAQLQLYSDWTLWGSSSAHDQYGRSDQRTLRLQKVA